MRLRRTNPSWICRLRSNAEQTGSKAIVAAKSRLGERQREADTARGRSEGDQRKPHDRDSKPKGGR